MLGEPPKGQNFAIKPLKIKQLSRKIKPQIFTILQKFAQNCTKSHKFAQKRTKL